MNVVIRTRTTEIIVSNNSVIITAIITMVKLMYRHRVTQKYYV